MKDGLKIKPGCTFSFEGRKYIGGTKKDTVPANVLARVEKLKEKPNLDKIKFVEEKPETKVKKDNGKSKGNS
jgi:hypothetical protein